MKKKISVYRKAAKAIADGKECFACHAIERRAERPREKFLALFHPRKKGASCAFFSYEKGTSLSRYLQEKDSRDLRVLALCFMVAMDEAGDL